MWNKKTIHHTKRPGEVHSSGKKPHAQKGSGRARQGYLRASGRRKAGKSFGHVPKDFTYYLPEKIKIQGLKATLSAKLAEGEFVIC